MSDISDGDLQMIIESDKKNLDAVKFHTLILESINDVIGISSQKSGIIFLTPSVQRETGWFSENMISKNIFDLAHKEDFSAIKSALDRLEQENEVAFEWRSRKESGEYGWVEIVVKNVTSAEDNCVYRIFSCRNIQRRKELEAELLKTTEELSNLNKMKDKFFSIIAHDLKNPLFSLITLTEFMQLQLAKLSKTEISEFLNQMNDTAKNSFILLENLLEWAKSQSGSIDFNPEIVSIEKVIYDCWKLAKSQAMNKSINITMDIQNNLSAFADYKMLCTIVRNIISNAIKYSKEKGQIRISASQQANYVIIKIEDNGIGMSREQLKYLFSVDPRKLINIAPAQHGSGLGLILCKEFIERHNGKMEVESSIGKGSSFILKFPLIADSTDK